MGKMLKYFLILSKRLLLRPGFIVVLLLIPVASVFLWVTSLSESGFVRIAYVIEDENDNAAKVIAEYFEAKSNLFSFTKCESESEAKQKVIDSEADTAWIIKSGLSKSLSTFVKEGVCLVPKISVYVRSDTVDVRISREKLSGVLSSIFSKELFLDFARVHIIPDSDMNDEAVMSYFENAFGQGELFEYKYADVSVSASDYNKNYLLTPARGFLSIIVMFSGLVMAMYYKNDEKERIFCRITGIKGVAFSFIYHYSGIVYTSLAMLISIFILGLGTSFQREFMSIILLSISCALFGILIRYLCVNIKILSITSPLIIAATLAISSIFTESQILIPLQRCLPVYYYLASIHRQPFIYYTLVYIAALSLIDLALHFIHKRFSKA